MAVTATTVTSAITISDTSISVTSATGFTPGARVRVDQEVMKVASNYPGTGTTIPVIRGIDGTAGVAHKSGANAVAYLPTDQAGPAPQTYVQLQTSRARVVTSISVTGAIPLPTPGSDLTCFLNGTTIIAATLANPTKDQDGDELTIVGNGKAAHTVTYTAGLGNVGATADVLTFSATQAGGFKLVAANGFWNNVGTVVGAASVGGPGIG